MATLLFKLSNVPDDEAIEVRRLLEEHNIPYYETDAGFWRVGVDALWLSDDTQQERAKALLEDYQKRRTAAQQELYQQQLAEGAAETFVGKNLRKPLRFILLVLAILFVLGVTLLPFMAFLTSQPGK